MLVCVSVIMKSLNDVVMQQGMDNLPPIMEQMYIIVKEENQE